MGGGRIRVGISGWRYPAWRGGAFYPKGLVQRGELHFASRRLNAVEINGTFYSLQRAAYFRTGRAATPEDCVFAVKGGRFVTHMKKLRDVAVPLANFFASGLLELGPKLGPVLWQLPASQRYDPERLQTFFDLLPRTQALAAKLAEGHDRRVKEPGWSGILAERPVRHALEVRHRSFEDPSFPVLLRRDDRESVV